MPPKIETDEKVWRRLYMRTYRRKQKAKINKLIKNKEVDELRKMLWGY